jgi:pantetheine-phosphate adenylyltransferase
MTSESGSKPKIRAAFPGSFDPPTLGHLNIIERASSLFDELLVVVAGNRQKSCLFSSAERAAMMTELVNPWKNVSVGLCEGFVVDFIRERGIRLMLRGLRGASDFSYEFEVAMMNKSLDAGVETLFMNTDPRYLVLRSSTIKELASMQADVSAMVPPLVARALKKKYPKGGLH